LIFGIGLAVASKRFAVAVDPRLEKGAWALGPDPTAEPRRCGCFGFAEDAFKRQKNS